MQYLNFPRQLLILMVVMILMNLAGCNLPSDASESPTLNVTQAYRTVEARLTLAVAQTPSPSTTPSPTQGSLAETTPSVTPQPSLTPTIEMTTSTITGSPCDQATFVRDVTIPDGTELQPGQEFTKIWRLQNVGSCTWTEDYSLVYFSGDQLGAHSSISLSGDVPSGQTVDLSVDMQAPEQPGTYRGNWKLRDDSGDLFGIGPSGGSAFWVEIKVLQPPSGTPTASTQLTVTPTLTPTVAVQVSGSTSLTAGDRLDLDRNQINPGSSEDLTLEAGVENHLLSPLGNATMAVFGSSQPALDDCQSATLSADALIVEDNLSSGVYLCYRTDMALPGWALVTGFDAETVTLHLDIFTWAIP